MNTEAWCGQTCHAIMRASLFLNGRTKEQILRPPVRADLLLKLSVLATGCEPLLLIQKFNLTVVNGCVASQKKTKKTKKHTSDGKMWNKLTALYNTHNKLALTDNLVWQMYFWEGKLVRQSWLKPRTTPRVSCYIFPLVNCFHTDPEKNWQCKKVMYKWRFFFFSSSHHSLNSHPHVSSKT